MLRQRILCARTRERRLSMPRVKLEIQKDCGSMEEKNRRGVNFWKMACGVPYPPNEPKIAATSHHGKKNSYTIKNKTISLPIDPNLYYGFKCLTRCGFELIVFLPATGRYAISYDRAGWQTVRFPKFVYVV